MAKTFFSNAYAKEEKHAEQKKNGRTCQTFAKGKLTEKWVAIKEKLPVCMLDTYSTFQFFNSRYAGILHNFISLFFFLRIFFPFCSTLARIQSNDLCMWRHFQIQTHFFLIISKLQSALNYTLTIFSFIILVFRTNFSFSLCAFIKYFALN